MAHGQKSAKTFPKGVTADKVLEGLDLDGKYCIVTGGNSGIGFEAARTLALHNANVVMACRNAVAAAEALEKILAEKKNAKISFLHFDCSDLSSVERFVKQYFDKGWPLNMLILNAGVYKPVHRITTDGFDSTFQINHLAHFYLTELLQPILIKSAPARVIVVASIAYNLLFRKWEALIASLAGGLEVFGLAITRPPTSVDRSHGPPAHLLNWRSRPLACSIIYQTSGMIYVKRVMYWGPRQITWKNLSPTHKNFIFSFHAYGASKFCNILFASELNRRLKTQGVTAYSLHPGMVSTEITRNSGLIGLSGLFKIARLRVVTPDKGAATTVFCAGTPNLETSGHSGKFFANCRPKLVAGAARNKATASKLWDLSQEMICHYKQNRLTIKE